MCEGWATIDLAAHLVVRERDPRSAPGIMFGGRFDALLGRIMSAAKARGYARLVEQVRNGPPIGPFAVPGLRKLLNLNEYVVHHEDVRRANGLEPRGDRPDLQAAMWGMLRHGGRLMLRRAKGITVNLVGDDGQVITVGTGPSVTIAGSPLELILYLQGRRSAAIVALTGAPEALAVLEGAALGI